MRSEGGEVIVLMFVVRIDLKGHEESREGYSGAGATLRRKRTSREGRGLREGGLGQGSTKTRCE